MHLNRPSPSIKVYGDKSVLIVLYHTISLPSFLSEAASEFVSLSNTTGTMVGTGRELGPEDVHSFAWLWFKLVSSITIDSMVLLSKDEVLSAIS